MPRSPTRTGGPTFRLLLQREDTGETIAQYGNLPQSRIRPILEGLSALVQLAGFKRDLESLLGRLGL
jgi:hypothetical protein